jgi:MoaA/NifB/PqqE/SkfB family radical SAM enzyme
MEYTLYYRNYLRYCNYKCSYCPFSKYKLNKDDLKKDKMYFEKFIEFLKKSREKYRIFIAPRGEILDFAHYKSGIITLSNLENILEIVIQTNLSGDLSWLESVNKNKVLLWTTYHPDETTFEDFYGRIQFLDREDIKFSVGTVGVHENFEMISKLKEKIKLLEKSRPYLWVNAYKDEKKYYTEDDLKFLNSVDHLFEVNLKDYSSKGCKCRTGENVFWTEYNGTVHRCWQDRKKLGNIFKESLESMAVNEGCRYSRCTCYIGYTNMKELGLEKLYRESLLGRMT